jgi:hypothetical protein
MEFEGELAGLEIVVRGLSGHGMVELAGLNATPDKPLPAVGLFVAQVDQWNLQLADGRSVPITYNAFLDNDMTFIKAVVGTWMRDVLSAPYPVSEPTDSAEPELSEPDGPDLTPWEQYVLADAVPVPA